MSLALIDPEVLVTFRELQSEGEPEFVKEYFTAMLKPLPGRIEKLKHGISHEDFQVVAHEAHAIKSSCSNAGAKAIVDRASQLEKLGQSRSLVGAMGIVLDLEQLIVQLRQEIYGLEEFRD